ncbi:MAG: DinB family protein [Candidatus Korobacteraceae bacterium]
MNSEQVKTIANFLIADMEHEMNTTLRVLESVPLDQMNYKPDPKSKSGLGLARHIALEDEWMLNSIADGAFPPPPDDSDACGILTPAEAVAHYKQRIPVALDRVRALNAEQLLKVVDLLGAVQMPAVNFICLALKHSVHHRGQLSAYLRAMGSTVPSIFGPSADTQMQMGKASAAD